MTRTPLFSSLPSGVFIRSESAKLGGMPRVVQCVLFRGRGTRASGRWRAWSGPDLCGLKVPLAPSPR